jgi:acetyl esterase/lipase
MLAGLACSVTCGTSALAREAVERGVAYVEHPADPASQSYDLFRPASPDGASGALVVFVHSRLWRERQPDRLVEDSFVRGLVEAGHAVAVVRHRLGPEGRHPAAVQDAAAAVAALLDRVDAGGIEADRVFLAGHSSGAWAALLLALDPSWLAPYGYAPDALAGVVSISGIVDLTPATGLSDEEEAIYAEAFPGPAARAAASPADRRAPSRPAILLLTAARDVPGYRDAAVRMAEALRAQGGAPVEAFIANGRDHFSILALADPRNDARRHVLPFLAADPREGDLPDSWRVLATWRNPPYTTADFHERFAALVEEHPADDHFLDWLNHPFHVQPGAPRRLVVSRYQAIDLMRLLEAMDPGRVGEGDWLELRNVRGEMARFDLRTLRDDPPRVVIGVDDERNLFRATDLYHTRRRYTWTEPEAERIDMARPLGAFIYFPKAELADLEASDEFGRFALTIDSFRRRRDDPWAALADLPPRLHEMLTGSFACVACHRFREIGGRALHIRAVDAAPMGGHALPLERYPAIVWKRFVFDQARVAEEIGATPIVFTPDEAQALYDLVVHEREARRVEPWTHPERDRDRAGDAAARAGD